MTDAIHSEVLVGASRVAVLPAVQALFWRQRAYRHEARPGGRGARHQLGDLPDAPVKIFLTASAGRGRTAVISS